MVDTGPLDLANFLARNRQAGGVNAQLADVLAGNLAPRPQPIAPPIAPGLFGVGREPGDFGRESGDKPERPRPRGGSLLTLASLLTGGATFPLAAIAGLVANDAAGRPPSLSLIDAFRSGDRPDRGRVSRPDRVRSASNREAGGGFTR